MFSQYFEDSRFNDLNSEFLEYLRKNWGNGWILEEEISRDCKLSDGGISADQILYPLRAGNFYGIKFKDESQIQEMKNVIEVGLDEYLDFIDNINSHYIYHSFFKLIYVSCLYFFIIDFFLKKGDIKKPLKILLYSAKKIKGISGLRIGLFLMSLTSNNYQEKFWMSIENNHNLKKCWVVDSQQWLRAVAISTIMGSYFHEMLKHTKEILLLEEPEISQEAEELISIISKNSDSEIIVEKNTEEFITRSFVRLFVSADGIKNHYNIIYDLI